MNSILCITTYPDTDLYKLKRLLLSLLFKTENLTALKDIKNDSFENMYNYCVNTYERISSNNIKIVFAIDGISGQKYNNYKLYENNRNKTYIQDISLLKNIIQDFKKKYNNIDICGTYNHTNVSINRSIICQLYKKYFITFMDDDDISCNLDIRNLLIENVLYHLNNDYVKKIEKIKKDFEFKEDLNLYDFLKLKNKYYKRHGNTKKDLYDKYFQYEICQFTSQIFEKQKCFIHSLTTIGFLPYCLDTVFSVSINQQEDVAYYSELNIYKRDNILRISIYDINYVFSTSQRDYIQEHIAENLSSKRLMNEKYNNVHNTNNKLNKKYGKTYYNQYSIVKFVQNEKIFNKFAGNCPKPKIYKYFLKLSDEEIDKYNDVC